MLEVIAHFADNKIVYTVSKQSYTTDDKKFHFTLETDQGNIEIDYIRDTCTWENLKI